MTKIGSWLKKIIFYGVFQFLILFASSAWSQVQVSATPDRKILGEGDTFTVVVSVVSSDSVESQDPRMPDLEGFELLNQWTNTSSAHHMSFENGKPVHTSEQRTNYNYMLAAKKKGNFTIGSFDVVVQGKSYQTKPFPIQVLEAGTAPTNPRGKRPGQGLPNLEDDEPNFGSPSDDAEDLFNQLLKQREQILKNLNPGSGSRGGIQGFGFGPSSPPVSRKLPVNTEEAFFVWPEVDKREAYEGEQITVSWYIYTRGQMETLDRLKFPDLRGFWKEIIEEVPALRFELEIVNGVEFKKALLASHALFPIKAGLAAIDEFKIRSKLRLLSNFGLGNPVTYTKSSKRIEIKVKPLPSEGKPKNFSGAVGDFQIKAFVENNQVNMGQPFTLKIRFEGTGNAKLIDLPNLNLPSSFEMYDTKSESRFFKDGTSYKEFDVVVVPKQIGNFTINPIELSMFNVNSKAYAAHHSEAITIDVLAGTAKQNGGDARLSLVDDKKKSEKVFIPQLVASMSSPLWTNWQASRLNAYALLFFIVLVALGFKSYSELTTKSKRRTLQQNIETRIKRIEPALKSKEARQVGVEMTNLYYYVLGEVSGLGGANQEIQKLLDAAPSSLRREFSVEILQNFEFFQLLTFAPEHMVNTTQNESRLQDQIKKATTLLNKIADSFEEIKQS